MIKARGRNTESPAYGKWLIFNICGLFLIFAASMAAPAFPYYWNTFYKYIYKILSAALLLGYIFFVGARGKIEVKLCFAFCLWTLISRLLNGDYMLRDGEIVLSIAVSCMFLPLCIMLDEKKRSVLLDIFSLTACLFFSIGALISIYTAITGRLIINPFSQWYFSTMEGTRLYMYGENPNTVGNWMLICIGLLLYQFFKRKNPAAKGLMLLLLAVNYIAAALADSRNSMLGISVCAGALVLMLALKYLPLRKMSLRAAAALLLVIAIIPTTYMSFAGVRHVISLSASSFYIGNEAEASETAAVVRGKYYIGNLSAGVAEEEPPELYEDTRGFSDSGRIPIYKSAIESIKREPLRLLRGSLNEHLMDITNEDSEHPMGHFHNSLIQALEFTGLPGFLLAAAFMVLLAIRAAVLFFCSDSRADFAVRSLTIILPGLYIYNMLETSIFYKMDFGSLAFFIIAGAVLAYSYEICPPKKKTK